MLRFFFLKNIILAVFLRKQFFPFFRGAQHHFRFSKKKIQPPHPFPFRGYGGCCII